MVPSTSIGVNTIRLAPRAESARTSAGADHDPLGAGVERRLDRPGVAQAAAELDGRVDCCRDPPQMLEVVGRALAGAVQIDHVQPLGAAPGPALGRVERVGVVLRLALVVALNQADRATAEDVDRRVEDQAGWDTDEQMAAKFRRRRRPAPLDFSGWNWA